MVNMTDSANIAMWFSPLEFFLCHFNLNPPSLLQAHNQIRTGDPVLTKNVLYLLSYVGPTSFIPPGSPELHSSANNPLVEGGGFEPP